MAERNRPPFEQFFNNFPNGNKGKQEQEPASVDWSDLITEVSKTWKSISPIVKPMMDKFKK
ncbi:hypothetical protein [Halobacillus mangrovi]|uniref:hypothetical protein n=1 Tax=Halobacillus mangrovi TaxID=402384 RepID=UPI003D97D286